MAKNLVLANCLLLVLSLASAEDSCAVAGNCPESVEIETDGGLALLQKKARAHHATQHDAKTPNDITTGFAGGTAVNFAENAENAVVAQFAENAKEVATAEGAASAEEATKADNADFSKYAETAYFASTAESADHTCSQAATANEPAECANLRELAVKDGGEDDADGNLANAAASLAQKFAHRSGKAKAKKLALRSRKSKATWEYESPECMCDSMEKKSATLVQNAVNATCAKNAENALFAEDAKFADQAVVAQNAEDAMFAEEALNAVYAQSAGKATYAFEVHPALMQKKVHAHHATKNTKPACDIDVGFASGNPVNFAHNALSAEVAQFAWNASQVANAEGAAYAEDAENANNATFSKFAETAWFASKAETAKHTCSQTATANEPAACADLRKLAAKDEGEDGDDDDDDDDDTSANGAGASLAQKLTRGLKKESKAKWTYEPPQGMCDAMATQSATELADATEAKCAKNAVNALFAQNAKFADHAVFAENALNAAFAVNALDAVYAQNAKLAEYAF